MGPDYAPARGIRRFLSGTPPILGMLAMQDMLALVEEAGIGAVRAKSVALTEHAIAGRRRAPGAGAASCSRPRGTPTGAAATSRSTTR